MTIAELAGGKYCAVKKMKYLRDTLYSEEISITVFTAFYPSIGGIETSAEVLAREWVASGHRVTIITDVPREAAEVKQFPFQVLHQAGPSEILRAGRKSDIVVHNNISLRAIWPLLLVRRPFVAVHHGFYCAMSAHQPWQERLKVWLARNYAHSISVSHAVQERICRDGHVIPNMYDADCFYDRGDVRSGELVFVGRLVSEKGVDIAVRALHQLRQQGLEARLTIIGDGPERKNIELLVHRLSISEQVHFVGRQDRKSTAVHLNRHKILVVPSLCHEGFGIVALEGAACGCVVVGSSGGGLPEAIGPCGVTFPNGDYKALAKILGELLRNPARLEPYRQAASDHLKNHRPQVVAARYIDFFHSVLGQSKAGPNAG